MSLRHTTICLSQVYSCSDCYTYHHHQQNLGQVKFCTNQQGSCSPLPKNKQFNMEKLPPEKSMMNHSVRLHATGHIQTIPIIMTQVCSPPTLLPCTSTLLTSQIVRNFSKLPSPNFKMTQSPLLKHDPAQTG